MERARYERADIVALATFDGIEYLGCDTTMAFDDERRLQQRLVTYWRGDKLAAETYSAHFQLSDPVLPSAIKEDVSLILDDRRAWASIPLREAVLREGQVWVQLRDSRGNVLPVESTLFMTEKGSDLLIWNHPQ